VNPGRDWIDGRLGGALAFTARGWLECPPAAFRTHAFTELTLAAWLMKEPAQKGLRAVVTRQLGQDSQDYFFLGFFDDQLLVASHLWRGRIAWRVPPEKRWMHVVATHDARGITRLYVDGQEVGREAGQPASLAGGETPLVIGGGMNGTGADANQRFQGALDELLLYERALPPQEIAALAAGTQPDL
jgi:hypothetical protein